MAGKNRKIPRCDFSGFVTRNDLQCSDGRTIMQNAFAHCDGKKVPLCWMHDHSEVAKVIGNVVLENRNEGVYGYGTFNNNPLGQEAKELVVHGDVDSLSIFANHLKQKNGDVYHGDIQEVSLVLSGANPGAFIDEVFAHGDEEGGEATGMYIGYDENVIVHADAGYGDYEDYDEDWDSYEDYEDYEDEEYETESDDETVGDILGTLTEKQMDVLEYLVGNAHEEGGAEAVAHFNLFEGNSMNGMDDGVGLSHADMRELEAVVLQDMTNYKKLSDSWLAHADDYGIEDIEFLFPDAKTMNDPPEFIKRDTGWVAEIINGTHHQPFTRIKTVFADITEDEARAKGYIKGNRKTEEVFSLLKRSTSPTTIYKKQKLDRDDIVDITSFDVVAWIKSEMRVMFDEELARCVMFGDGRLASSNDKVDEQCIRPIWKEDDLFAVHYNVNIPTGTSRAEAFIEAVIRSRKEYKGSGSPTMFVNEDLITDCLLLKDKNGRYIYEDIGKLEKTLRVSKIVEIPIMEGLVREVKGKKMALDCIIVNLKDYTIGTDKGGQMNFFDDFDIDFNQYKYLYEGRCSGSLTKPFSALVLEHELTNVAG